MTSHGRLFSRAPAAGALAGFGRCRWGQQAGVGAPHCSFLKSQPIFMKQLVSCAHFKGVSNAPRTSKIGSELTEIWGMHY